MHHVTQCQRKRSKPLTFPYAVRSFLGYLEGTEKAGHTVKSYRSDLVSFQEFIEKRLKSSLTQLSTNDLKNYHDFLKAQGLKTNTRRRKLLTVRKFLKYLTQRNKLKIDIGRKLPTPYKSEKIPLTVSSAALVDAIRALEPEGVLQSRNRVLLWTLAETGCQVSELTRIQFEDWHDGVLEIRGKSARALPVSRELWEEVLKLQSHSKARKHVFLGFNKHGSLGAPITSRGVELLVRAYADRLGFPELTPRTFRHSVVLKWFEAGASVEDIRKKLGLKTLYAFRSYQPLLKDLKPRDHSITA